MTTQNDRQALEEARAEGVAQAIQELRAFTGIPGYTPALNEPEHRAYPVYERDLAHGLDVWKDHQQHRQTTVDQLIERRNEARRAMDAEQQRRQQERAGSNLGGRIIGKLQDVSFPEKRDHAALSKDVDAAWEVRYAADARVLEIENELAQVTAWINQMVADVDASRAIRR